MGRLIIPIGVDIDAVKAIFGCKDEQLFKQLLNSKFFKKYDEEFSFKNEIYNIIFNYVSSENRIIKPSKLFGLIKGNDGRGLEGEWNDYGHALLTICCYKGKQFSDDYTEFIFDDRWRQINFALQKSNSGVDLSRMNESKQIFDTPFIHDDIYTNLYTKKEVSEFSKHTLILEKHIQKENLILFNTLKNSLFYCADNNLDLIIFSHEL